MAQRWHRHSRNYLRRLIRQSLNDCSEFRMPIEVDGEIRRYGEGMWHDNYRFHVQGPNASPARADCGYFLRLLERRHDWQQGPEPYERLIREAETLQVLTRTGFPYPTPTFICLVKDDEGEVIGMIETALPGASLDGVKDRTTLKLVGRVAATVHQAAIEQYPHLPSSPDRVEHVRERLGEFDEALFAEFPLARKVREWIKAHPPTDNRSCLLHGDLLPQNLLSDWRGLEREESLAGIIDWEMARVGDPAYDLAIVSRGNRKVLGVNEGVKFLVEDYLGYGGRPVSLTDVRVHELLLVLHWLEEAWHRRQQSEVGGQGPEFYENQLRSLLRRAAK